MKYNITIVGNGIVGMLTALSLSNYFKKIAIIGPKKIKNYDLRTTALMIPAIDLLKKLQLWNNIKLYASPIKIIRIIDDTNKIIKSANTIYNAEEIKENFFGYNIPNNILYNVIKEALYNCKNIFKISLLVKSYITKNNIVNIILNNNQVIKSYLVIAADGCNSIIRYYSGIKVHNFLYKQIGIVLNFSHELPHNNSSTEFYKKTGTFTQIPLLNNCSSLVWLIDSIKYKELSNLKNNDLELIIENNMYSFLGKIKIVSNLQYWPINGFISEKFANNRCIIIGEAAHTFPPIGAFGLNLGINDIIHLNICIKKNINDPGSINIIKHYNFVRKREIWFKTLLVNLINCSILSNSIFLQYLQANFFEVIIRFPIIKKFIMKKLLFKKVF